MLHIFRADAEERARAINEVLITLRFYSLTKYHNLFISKDNLGAKRCNKRIYISIESLYILTREQKNFKMVDPLMN